MRFSSSTGAVPTLFGGEIARGKHLFPFRTEPLSLSAPMVLGGQPPGRVGRRRSLSRAAPRGGSFSFRAQVPPEMAPPLRSGLSDRLALLPRLTSQREAR